MVLLVVMVLLTLMSLMGLTLVLVTAQGRLSALAASRRGLQTEHDNQELATVMTQVAAGSTDSNSVFGAHGLLEDLYGLPQFFGRIAPLTPVLPVGETVVGTSFTSGGNNGTFLQLVVIAAAPSGAAGLGPQNAMQYVLPQYSGAFCGQVMTMLTGPAAGQSGRVVGYYFNPVAQIASLQVSSFGGVVPQPGDEFMINGRPFAGTGFGLDLTKFQPQPGAQTGPWVAPYTQPMYTNASGVMQFGPLLTAAEIVPNPASPPDPGVMGMPYAFLPNHARVGLTPYAPTAGGTYWDAAGPGGANEPYDAADFQNLMLAMHYWDGGSGVITPVPTLHRPELVAWYYFQALNNGNPAISMANPDMRRKVILRPEPSDHYYFDSNGNGVYDFREPWYDANGNGTIDAGEFLDLNGDTVWTAGDTDYAGNTFNPITGCWRINGSGNWMLDTKAGLDVDNDQDGTPDSIWVDAGLPVHTESDGTLTKNLAAVLCIDLDGKINLNAHGNLAQLDVFRYPYNPYSSVADVGQTPNPWKPTDVNGVPVAQNTIPGPVTAAGGVFTYFSTDISQRMAPVAQGYGPADVNLVHLFRRSHGDANALNYYRVFLQGFDGYPTAPSSLPPVDGRYGESTRLSLFGVPGFNYPGVFPPGEYSPPWKAVPGLTWTQSYMNGPRPGWSQWYDPFSTSLLFGSGLTTSYWVNDPVALARFSDIRPHLLEPALAAATPFFFDFLSSTGVFPAHQPTGHGTPSDLHSRGFQMTDVTGRPYYPGTAALPWLTMPGTWSSVMNDQAVVNYYTGNPALDLVLANERVLNEGVDTPYELDPRQNSRQGGQNTGNSINGIPDFAALDNKVSASEYEGIARYHEAGVGGAADSGSLVSRLNSLETAANYLRTGSTAPQTTQLADDKVRLALTSDSSDLPVPNLALTPQQMKDITQYLDYFSASTGLALGNGASLNLGNISLTELARARIFADNYNPNTPAITGQLLNITPSFADLALFGNLKNTQQSVLVFPTLNPAPVPGVNPNVPVWPLLAPETVLGMRLDVNRLLGNGVDDNGNGVVDEPDEVVWPAGAQAGYAYGESLAYPYSRINTTQLGPLGQQNLNVGVGAQNNAMNMLGVLDLNDDGFYPTLNNGTGFSSVDPQLTTAAGPVYLPNDPTNADMRARQLLARHLYCLAMLLLDDRPYYLTAGAAGNNPLQQIMAQIFSATGPSLIGTNPPYPLGWPGGLSYQTLAGSPTPPALYREQAAYVIAQWAINVVDFRDRDSIMTPFEFDLYPFRADDPTKPNVTWNVDDIIDPLTATGTLPATSDDAAAWRGLVWGCERPELLMTETAGFHDRGTANTNAAQATGNNQDTYYDPNNPAATDTDYDQVRRPRGSLIVELFNPTNYWDAPQFDMQQPYLQLDGNGNQGYGVNLSQVATGPVVGVGPASSPVWRLVIAYSPWVSESGYYNNAPPTATVLPGIPYPGGSGYSKSPASASKQIDNRVPILPPSAIHRAVYFAPYQPAFITGATPTVISLVADTYLSNSFFADPNAFALPATPAMLLPPGQYAMVAPATQMGTPAAGNFMCYAGSAPTGLISNVWSLQMGSGAPYNTVSYVNAGGAPSGPYGAGYGITTPLSTTIKPVIGLPIQTTWFTKDAAGNPVYLPHVGVTSAVNPTTTLRMSLSEPEHGYPVWPTATPVLNDDGAYYTTVGTPTSGNFPQHPFDSTSQNQNTGGATLQFSDSPNLYTAPTTKDTTTNQPWTTPGYTVLYLQRLANPLHPWDSKVNPYITVDGMPVDLTAYTGEPNQTIGATPAPKNVADPIMGSNTGIGGKPSFDTRRRGYDPSSSGSKTLLSNQGTPNIWTPLPTNAVTNPYLTSGNYGNNAAPISASLASPMATADNCTLGYLNAEYSGGPYPTGVYTGNTAPVGTSGVPVYQYNGDPMKPFPWLAWNNRPYISQYELMLVPASSASSQLQDFGMLGWNGGIALKQFQPYSAGAGAGQIATPTANSLPAAQFMQLLNFFNSEQTLTTTDTTNLLPNLYRVFEFLQVPSRFTGTQDMLDPSQFAGNDAVMATQGLAGATSHLFHTPFNWLSRYREPGKINLNTIFDPIVFKALADDYPGALYVGGLGDPTTMWGATSLWQSVFLSRQGFSVPTAYTMPPNPVAQFSSAATAYPTYFANPFRPDGATAFSPPTTWNPPVNLVPGTLPVSASPMMQPWSYPGTLPGLYSGTPAGTYTGVNATLLRQPQISGVTTNLALFDDTYFDTTNSGATYKTGNTAPYRNAGQNAAFQYQMFTRLGNTTTNRSNVYAIWITLGKFEVQAVAVNPQNPDGYKLVKPYLDATGNQVVTRGFYIFDRSIPMGFQRGQDVNIERGMLVERVLQIPQ